MDDRRPAPLFISDDLALDFLNSIATPWGQQIEWLASGGDLLAWLDAAHAVPSDVLTQFRKRTGLRPLDAVAHQARELREWFRIFVHSHAGKPLTSLTLRELAPLNRLLVRDEAYRQIESAPPSHGGENDGDEQRALRWKAMRRWPSPKALLLPVAEAIGDLVCHKNFSLVRKCEGPTCTLWFHDVSKGHARRWCSMAVCGNRAKAVAHRARARQRLTAEAHLPESKGAPS
jgi:predicted RNA-binding Zn ribbon-like protein